MAINVALCTPEIKPGAVLSNTEKIKNCIFKAKKADLIVFPRLCITGVTCGSMYSFPILTSAALNALDDIAAATDKTVIIGLPTTRDGRVYDSIAVIQNGNYSIYSPAKGMTEGGKNSLTYGEDIIPDFDIEGLTVRILPEIDSAPGADLVLVPTAYPSYLGTTDEVISAASAIPAAIVVSSGKGESVSGKVMSGDKIVTLNGKLEEYAGYDEEIITAKIGKIKDSVLAPKKPPREISFTPLSDKECGEAYDIMGRGIVGRMSEIGTNKVILGLSGGLDSANVLVAAVLAFEKYKIDKKNIICVTMRGNASSKRTQDNAASLIDAFKVTGINVPIDSAVSLHLRSIGHEAKDVVYENAQARERTQILLDLSNKHNALMLGTGDLSEICLGWSTFGGDQLSQYNPNCSLTKTAIRALLRYYSVIKHNKAAAKIIEDILATPVSPELLSGQETETILGPYEVHDYFIREIVAKKKQPKDIISDAISIFGLSEATVKQYLKTFLSRLFRYQFKRNFGPDGVQLFPYDLTDLTIRSDFSPELWLKNCGL
ncbi:MAG: NAD(+) synthase [Clostridiales bacterium]|nr:NAD(+) synthase [Clostridiales bacterium]